MKLPQRCTGGLAEDEVVDDDDEEEEEENEESADKVLSNVDWLDSVLRLKDLRSFPELTSSCRFVNVTSSKLTNPHKAQSSTSIKGQPSILRTTKGGDPCVSNPRKVALCSFAILH
jgi:hypothetical protein